MNVKQFRYSMDNFGYLIYGQEAAIIVDGGAVDALLAFIDDHDLALRYVVNTHDHQDHTVGTQAILDRTDAQYLDNNTLRAEGTVTLGNETIRVYHTPGHTGDSVSFHVDNFLIAGDTLFNGTVGNCFTGDLKAFYDSIKMLLALPDETIVYAGHDYVEDSIAFAKSIEPDNEDPDRFMETYDPAHVRSTLGVERKINPFLRFNEPAIISYLEKKGLPVGTELERWESVMTL